MHCLWIEWWWGWWWKAEVISKQCPQLNLANTIYFCLSPGSHVCVLCQWISASKKQCLADRKTTTKIWPQPEISGTEICFQILSAVRMFSNKQMTHFLVWSSICNSVRHSGGRVVYAPSALADLCQHFLLQPCRLSGTKKKKKKNQRTFQSLNGFENNMESFLYCKRGKWGPSAPGTNWSS